MKKRLKKGLVVTLFAAAVSLAFAGCSSHLTKDDLLTQEKLTTEVIYYANGGCFDDDFEKVEKTMYYRDNSYAYKIEEQGTRIVVEKADYELLGWYYAQLDSNGAPIKDASGEFAIGEAVPFDKPISEWSSTKIVASWASLAKVKVKLVIGNEGDPIGENEVVTIETKFGNTTAEKDCKTGDEIRDYSFVNGQVQSVAELTLKVKDNAYTFLALYADEACTKAVEWPLKKPDASSKDSDVYIYAKYIKGNWTMLSLPSDVSSMYTGSASNDSTTRYFLKNDIDCASITKTITPRVKFNCELKGNGYTISNLKISRLINKQDEKCAFFGVLGEHAKITNVVFENVTMEYTSRFDASIYLVFTEMQEGAVLENVQFKKAKIVLNFANNAELSNDMETNWKFGGYETDEAYTGGCTVDADSTILKK